MRACVRERRPHITVCSCVHPLLPPPPPPFQNRGLSPVTLCIGELPTRPSLPYSHLSHPPTSTATAGGGHMVQSSYLSPPLLCSCRASQWHGHIQAEWKKKKNLCDDRSSVSGGGQRKGCSWEWEPSIRIQSHPRTGRRCQRPTTVTGERTTVRVQGDPADHWERAWARARGERRGG